MSIKVIATCAAIFADVSGFPAAFATVISRALSPGFTGDAIFAVIFAVTFSEVFVAGDAEKGTAAAFPIAHYIPPPGPWGQFICPL